MVNQNNFLCSILSVFHTVKSYFKKGMALSSQLASRCMSFLFISSKQATARIAPGATTILEVDLPGWSLRIQAPEMRNFTGGTTWIMNHHFLFCFHTIDLYTTWILNLPKLSVWLTHHLRPEHRAASFGSVGLEVA